MTKIYTVLRYSFFFVLFLLQVIKKWQFFDYIIAVNEPYDNLIMDEYCFFFCSFSSCIMYQGIYFLQSTAKFVSPKQHFDRIPLAVYE